MNRSISAIRTRAERLDGSAGWSRPPEGEGKVKILRWLRSALAPSGRPVFLVAIIAFLFIDARIDLSPLVVAMKRTIELLEIEGILFDDRLSDEARHALHGARRRCGTCWAPARGTRRRRRLSRR